MEKGELFRIVAVGRGGRNVSVSGGDIPTSYLDKNEARKSLKELKPIFKGTGVRLKIGKVDGRYKWRG